MKSSHRRLIAPLVLLSILVAGIWLLWPRNVTPPTISEGESRGTKAVPPVTAAMLTGTDGIEVKNRYGTFVLHRVKERWFLDAPVKGPANDRLVAKILARLGGLRFGQVVTSDPSTFKEHLLTEKQAVTLHLKAGGTSQVKLFIGRSRKFTLIRAAHLNDVWNLKGALRQILVKDVRDWVEPQIAPFQLKDIAAVTYFGPRGEKLFAFKKNRDAVYEPVYGQVPKQFYSRNVTASVARLLRLRVRKVNDDRGKRDSYFTKPQGAVELLLADGKKVTFRFGDTVGNLIHIQSSLVDWIPLTHIHSTVGILLGAATDLVSPKILVVDPLTIKGIDGLCRGFAFGLTRKDRGPFTLKPGSMEFHPARSRMQKWQSRVRKGYLRAEKVVGRLAPEVSGISDKSDFLALTLDKGSVTVRFGKRIPAPEGGKVWQYVESTTNPEYTYIVRVERNLEICRNKLDWQLQASDMEDLPAKTMKPVGRPAVSMSSMSTMNPLPGKGGGKSGQGKSVMTGMRP